MVKKYSFLMKPITSSQAGTFESSDVIFLIEPLPENSGRKIELYSTVLLLVEEERSAFPFAVRWDLIRKGTAHLKNIVMVRGGMYVVSGAIFPSYFLKCEDPDEVMRKQAELDVIVFARYIVPVLKIWKRYVGTEAYCMTTAAYNESMKAILPGYGVEVIELERKMAPAGKGKTSEYISASRVRQAIKEDRIGVVLEHLPDSTWDFLLSDASLPIRTNIKKGQGRH